MCKLISFPCFLWPATPVFSSNISVVFVQELRGRGTKGGYGGQLPRVVERLVRFMVGAEAEA